MIGLIWAGDTLTRGFSWVGAGRVGWQDKVQVGQQGKEGLSVWRGTEQRTLGWPKEPHPGLQYLEDGIVLPSVLGVVALEQAAAHGASRTCKLGQVQVGKAQLGSNRDVEVAGVNLAPWGDPPSTLALKSPTHPHPQDPMGGPREALTRYSPELAPPWCTKGLLCGKPGGRGAAPHERTLLS